MYIVHCDFSYYNFFVLLQINTSSPDCVNKDSKIPAEFVTVLIRHIKIDIIIKKYYS